MVWASFQRVTTRYRQIYEKNIYEYFLKRLTVTRGNALQIAQMSDKIYGKASGSAWGNAFKQW